MAIIADEPFARIPRSTVSVIEFICVASICKNTNDEYVTVSLIKEMSGFLNFGFIFSLKRT